jgi:hypothetical protein
MNGQITAFITGTVGIDTGAERLLVKSLYIVGILSAAPCGKMVEKPLLLKPLMFRNSAMIAFAVLAVVVTLFGFHFYEAGQLLPM